MKSIFINIDKTEEIYNFNEIPNKNENFDSENLMFICDDCKYNLVSYIYLKNKTILLNHLLLGNITFDDILKIEQKDKNCDCFIKTKDFCDNFETIENNFQNVRIQNNPVKYLYLKTINNLYLFNCPFIQKIDCDLTNCKNLTIINTPFKFSFKKILLVENVFIDKIHISSLITYFEKLSKLKTVKIFVTSIDEKDKIIKLINNFDFRIKLYLYNCDFEYCEIKNKDILFQIDNFFDEYI